MSRWGQDTFEDRFWSKVDKTEGCWNWTASISGARGYGKINRDGVLSASHRVSWELANGPVPTGLCVLHQCDNRRCVRPEHLFLGTKKDNTADMWAKGRGSRAGSGANTVRGERHGQSKLTEAQVLEARRLNAGGASLSELCRRFGALSVGTMSRVVSGKLWSHLPTQVKVSA
jgi:hypothetical protein